MILHLSTNCREKFFFVKTENKKWKVMAYSLKEWPQNPQVYRKPLVVRTKLFSCELWVNTKKRKRKTVLANCKFIFFSSGSWGFRLSYCGHNIHVAFENSFTVKALLSIETKTTTKNEWTILSFVLWSIILYPTWENVKTPLSTVALRRSSYCSY